MHYLSPWLWKEAPSGRTLSSSSFDTQLLPFPSVVYAYSSQSDPFKIMSLFCSEPFNSFPFHQHKIQILTMSYKTLHYLLNPQCTSLMTSCPTHSSPCCLTYSQTLLCTLLPQALLAVPCAYKALPWSLHGLAPCLFQVLFKCHCIREAFHDSPVVILKYVHKTSETPLFKRQNFIPPNPLEYWLDLVSTF